MPLPDDKSQVARSYWENIESYITPPEIVIPPEWGSQPAGADGSSGDGSVQVPSADFQVTQGSGSGLPSADFFIPAPRAVQVPAVNPGAVKVFDALNALGGWLANPLGIEVWDERERATRRRYNINRPNFGEVLYPESTLDPTAAAGQAVAEAVEQAERRQYVHPRDITGRPTNVIPGASPMEVWRAREQAMLKRAAAPEAGTTVDLGAPPEASILGSGALSPESPAYPRRPENRQTVLVPGATYPGGAFSPSDTATVSKGDWIAPRVPGDVPAYEVDIQNNVLQNPEMLRYARANNLSGEQIGRAGEWVMNFIADEIQRGVPVTNRELLDPAWMAAAIRAALRKREGPPDSGTKPPPGGRGGGGGGGGGGGSVTVPPVPPVTNPPPLEPNARPAQPNAQGILLLEDAMFATAPSNALQNFQRLLQSLGFQATGVYGRYVPTEWRGRPGLISVTEDMLRSITNDPTSLAWLRWMAYRLGWYTTASPYPTGGSTASVDVPIVSGVKVTA